MVRRSVRGGAVACGKWKNELDTGKTARMCRVCAQYASCACVTVSARFGDLFEVRALLGASLALAVFPAYRGLAELCAAQPAPPTLL